MVRVTLIALAAACSAPSQPAPAARPTTPTTPESPWDHGTFIEVDKEKISPNTEETFDVYKTPSGYRYVVVWNRPMPTGELGDGKATLELDRQLSVVAGEMVGTVHMKDHDETTRSRITRQPDGRLVTEISKPDGTSERVASEKPNSWYIGGTTTSFLTAMCVLDASAPSPVVFPDKDTTMSPPQPLPIEGSARDLTFRTLTYAKSGHEVVAACENGKLAGEVTRGVTIVREGDLALARVLEARFR